MKRVGSSNCGASARVVRGACELNALGAVLCLCLLFAGAAPARPAPAMATVRLTPQTLTFGSQLVGTSSVSQPLTLSNTGTASFTIAKLTASGDFSQTNTCAGHLAGGPSGSTSCTINVTFTPTAKGLRRGTLTLLDNATGSLQLVHLEGVGTQLKLSAGALSFEGQPVRNPSSPKLVTLTNMGNTPLGIAEIRITPPVEVWGSPLDPNVSSMHRAVEFAETNACGTSLAPGASCTVSITFTPRRAGSSRAWLIVSHDGGGSPQRVTLWGVGVRF